MLHQILNSYTPGEWTVFGVLIGVFFGAWKVLFNPLIKAIWELIRTWRKMSDGFPKLTEQVTQIKELLKNGSEWMNRHEIESKDTIRRVGVLETNVNSLGERTARLEGFNV